MIFVCDQLNKNHEWNRDWLIRTALLGSLLIFEQQFYCVLSDKELILVVWSDASGAGRHFRRLLHISAIGELDKTYMRSELWLRTLIKFISHCSQEFTVSECIGTKFAESKTTSGYPPEKRSGKNRHFQHNGCRQPFCFITNGKSGLSSFGACFYYF